VGVLEMAYDENFALKLTPLGKEILFGKRKIELTVLQALDRKAVTAGEKKAKRSLAPSEELFDRLRNVRRDFAMKENVPAYIIFSDATLQAMASEKPRNRLEMLDVTGVGEHKMARYGQAFIDAVLEFMEGPGSKAEKGNTYQETLSLYRQGLNPEEIAIQRKISPQTAYSHLAYLYLRGNISSLEEFVSWQEVEQVRKAVKFLGGKTPAMKPIFEHLNESISYLKIRLALAVIEKETEGN